MSFSKFFPMKPIIRITNFSFHKHFKSYVDQIIIKRTSAFLIIVSIPTCHPLTVIIRINAAAFIKFLVRKVRRLFEGGVYLRAALIAHFVKTTYDLFKTQLNQF